MTLAPVLRERKLASPKRWQLRWMKKDRVAECQAGRPAISADGRYVAFEMWAAKSAAQASASASQIVLADTCLGDTPVVCSASAKRISYAPDGSALGGANISPSRSAATDASWCSNRSRRIPPTGSTGGISRAFLRDTCLGRHGAGRLRSSTTLVASELRQLPPENAEFFAGQSARPEDTSRSFPAPLRAPRGGRCDRGLAGRPRYLLWRRISRARRTATRSRRRPSVF